MTPIMKEDVKGRWMQLGCGGIAWMLCGVAIWVFFSYFIQPISRQMDRMDKQKAETDNLLGPIYCSDKSSHCNLAPCDRLVSYDSLDGKVLTFKKDDLRTMTYDYAVATNPVYARNALDPYWTEITLRDGTRTLIHQDPFSLEIDFANCDACSKVGAGKSHPCRR